MTIPFTKALQIILIRFPFKSYIMKRDKAKFPLSRVWFDNPFAKTNTARYRLLFSLPLAATSTLTKLLSVFSVLEMIFSGINQWCAHGDSLSFFFVVASNVIYRFSKKLSNFLFFEGVEGGFDFSILNRRKFRGRMWKGVSVRLNFLNLAIKIRSQLAILSSLKVEALWRRKRFRDIRMPRFQFNVTILVLPRL